MNTKKVSLLGVVCLSICSTVFAQQTQSPETENAAQVTLTSPDNIETPLPLDQIRSFADIFTRIKLNYVEPVSDETLLRYAVEGMLSGLDPHSTYLKDEGFEEHNEGTRGAFNGLGMEVIMEDGFVKVVAPIDDTPAAVAGIKTGDLIIRIDDKSVSGLSLQEATDRMRGEPGTKIKLTVVREDQVEPFDVILERAVVRLSSVKRRRLSNDIGYLRVTQFQIATAENFRRELKMLRDESGFKGLILDLRNNPGGLLTSAVSIADTMLSGGTIVTTKSRRTESDQAYSATQTDLLDGKPVVVLINAGTASAAEIVAGALQDHKRALIVGTRSFGKGSVQTVINIGEDEAIKLTTARYYTPNGTSIQAEGIVPDVAVEYRQFKDVKVGVKRISEDDLPGHLENDNHRKTTTSALPESDEITEMLQADYQLNEAFNLMQGLILFTSR
ncbi:carboxyl-terminal protease [Arenicella chitinivorans]|uniref:Carboxyl-terminal protease n=1 Tax=Arenicella chitinivorans TaxID=1329800 RepID=A0A918RVP2_9GAMM|nr:S41 family peptidase [Arenicella chitinivorans]GHA14419.1 carboxyl-terminal protease [Arenicella chitinivorans]